MNLKSGEHDLSSLRIDRDNAEDYPERKWKLRLILAAILLAVLGVGYFLVSGTFSAPREVSVATATLTYPSQANAMLTASGYVVAQRKAAVASKGTGRLEFLGVEEGDRVKAGQIIARLEDNDVKANLAKARADLAIARADSVDAWLALHRQRTLFQSDLTSKAELDGAEARYNRVVALIQSAIAGVAAAEVALENTRIRAPFNGTVLTKNAEVGEIVAPFASSANSRGAVVTIADMTSLEAEADVSESNITRVSVSQPCEIILDAYPDRRYQGYVHKIVPTADRAKATVLTKVRFKEFDERVLPEMSAKVIFLSKEIEETTRRQGPRLTVPLSAVVNRDGREVVLVVKDGKVNEQVVRSGERIGNTIEIIEGLHQGDQVVTRPDPDLNTGDKVLTKA